MKNLTLKSWLVALPLFISACASPPAKAPTPVAPSLLKCAPVSDAERPTLLWSTPGFSAPESVVYDSKKKTYYVSNVVGSPVEKDQQGWISKMDPSGKISQLKWVEGLNAPKGLGLKNGTLWTSDIDTVVRIQTNSGKKSKPVSVEGAKFLNDITFGTKGDVLVSDMFTNRIHSLYKSSKASVFSEGRQLENPNGITSAFGSLLIASWGNDIQSDFTTPVPGRVLGYDFKTKKITPWSELPLGNLDGIEMISKDTAIVSDWMTGKVFRIKKGGECTLLLEGFKGSADLTYIAKTRTLVIPIMGEDRVAAYKLP